MPPQFKIFRVPAAVDSEEEAELNKFLRSVRSLTIHRDFVEAGAASFTVFLKFQHGAGLDAQFLA